eukprot:scaffold25289_cov46-Attheya_sp.AAC.5
MEQHAMVAVDSMAVVEMEVIGMMPTRMMPLIMQAPIIIMHRVSAASMVTNHTNASGWGTGNQSANNAAANNLWIDSIGAPE